MAIADFDALLAPAAIDLQSLRGARLCITGGTGFVGTWLLESLAWANARLATKISAVVVTRNAAAFARKAPHLAADPSFTFREGDIRSVAALNARFDGVVHAATPASAELNRAQPLVMLDTIVEGGRAVLELAARSGAIPFLFTSSGAVYGRNASQPDCLPESYAGAPDPLATTSAYAEGKRVAELQCALVARASGLRPKIARLFAFVGPYLPLDSHFAIGNFIRDALAGQPVVVAGDGMTVRSYLFAADMVVWLWAVYCRGEPLRAYNIGSPEAIDMRALATLVAKQAHAPGVEIRQHAIPGAAADRYVPDVSRITTELGAERRVSLEAAIARTLAYHAGSGLRDDRHE